MYATHITGRLIENPVLAEQAMHNSQEQFALGDYQQSLMDAVIEGMDKYNGMAAQVLNNERVQRDFAEIIPGAVYAGLRQRQLTSCRSRAEGVRPGWSDGAGRPWRGVRQELYVVHRTPCKGSMASELGQLIRDTRTAREIGLRELARMINKSPAFLTQLERDDHPPPASEETLRTIAEALDLNVDEVLVLASRTPSDVAPTSALEVALYRKVKGMDESEQQRLLDALSKATRRGPQR